MGSEGRGARLASPQAWELSGEEGKRPVGRTPGAAGSSGEQRRSVSDLRDPGTEATGRRRGSWTEGKENGGWECDCGERLGKVEEGAVVAGCGTVEESLSGRSPGALALCGGLCD